jgi:hypothetical protein
MYALDEQDQFVLGVRRMLFRCRLCDRLGKCQGLAGRAMRSVSGRGGRPMRSVMWLVKRSVTSGDHCSTDMGRVRRFSPTQRLARRRKAGRLLFGLLHPQK